MSDAVETETLAIEGATATAIAVSDDREVVHFVLADGREVFMRHSQDCCERVELIDIDGDLDDLIETPLVVAERRTKDASGEVFPGGDEDYREESATWTFFTFRTIKGTVTMRWFGGSNGYYSETADIYPDTETYLPISEGWDPEKNETET